MSVFNNLEVKETVEEKNYRSSFLFQHLPANAAMTLGTYLRRVLFDYISGIAPLGIKITDKNGPVKTYFGALSGVAETGRVAHLVLKLKKIVLTEKKPKNGIFCLELNVENKEK